MKQRKRVWNRLENLISSLPYRTSIALLGDFNLTLQPYGKVACQGIFQGSQHLDLKQERNDLTQMLERHRLSALNTWQKKHYTYKHPSGSSQIDYIAVRQPLADREAKSCRPVKVTIAGWRSSGHEVLVASIRISAALAAV